MPVEVGRIILPPDRAALPQAAFRLVDKAVRGIFAILVACQACRGQRSIARPESPGA
jgi:hypothetical protein